MAAVNLLTIEEIHRSHASIVPTNITSREREKLFSQLFEAEERRKEGCVLIQAGGIVMGGKAFLITGTGTINILESIVQFPDVEGIIGNGNALFVSKDFERIYSTLTEEESLECYESEQTGRRMKYVYSAKLWDTVFLQRAFKDYGEYERFRKNQYHIWLTRDNEFVRRPLDFKSRYHSRLKQKFVKTCQIVHCCHRPTMRVKEMLYDDPEKISDVIENFNGTFVLGYTLYDTDLEKIMGFVNFVKWQNNPSEKMAKIVHQICSDIVANEKVFNEFDNLSMRFQNQEAQKQ